MTQNRSLNYMLFHFPFRWIYQFPNATNNTLILIMQKSRKLSLFLKQTKSNYFLLKQLSNFWKVPKVRFDGTRSMNLKKAMMHRKWSHRTMKEFKKTKQLTERNKKSYWIKTHFLFFVNEMREDYKCDFSMIKQAVKQVNRVSKLDQSLQNQIWLFWGEKLQNTFWN